jgi:hypothetical protein
LFFVHPLFGSRTLYFKTWTLTSASNSATPLIISGTHIAFLRASFDDADWTTLQTSTGGIVFINLQPLRLTDSRKLLEDVLTTVHRKTNVKEINKMPSVEEGLKWHCNGESYQSSS